ncbi:Alanine--tRNA ligase OS=Stutzerimonas stutzeri OX=316 GN=alaS PE=3 SV=1 [Stutzerimonas stutzeri]
MAVDSLSAGEEGVVVLDQTPFYAESGGQVGDCGYLVAENLRFDVRDTSKAGGAFLHHGILDSGNLRVGASVDATVDASVRQATALNHFRPLTCCMPHCARRSVSM